VLTSIVKCHLLDEDLVKMTMEALDTIYPFSDETIIIRTPDSVMPNYFEQYLDEYNIRTITAEKGFPNFVVAGMLAAKGDYVAVLNNDILMPANWSKPLLGLFNTDTLLVHPKMNSWHEEFFKGRQIKDNISPQEGMFFSAFILNKKEYSKLGWDTDYEYWGFDDWDFYYRARKKYMPCIWTDIVQYKHKGGATIGKIGREKFEEKNRDLFQKKHHVSPQIINWYSI